MVNRPAPPITRRRFLGSASALVLAPTVVPASALGREGRTPPSERILMGFIGLGSQGRSNLRHALTKERVQVVALCDVDDRHTRRARKMVIEKYAKRYGKDPYRDLALCHRHEELLARREIEAVSIAVPDHWHCHTAVTAARAGKDIYAEKPLARTIPEGRLIADTVHRMGLVWQTGSWQRSCRDFRFACELVRNGRIGRVTKVEVGLPTGSDGGSLEPAPVPAGFDYERWLGPAPEAPYTKDRTHWDFRWILDYSGGQVTDWGAHHCDIAQWGTDREHTGPVEIEGEGRFPRTGLWDAATHFFFTCRYAQGPPMTVSSTPYSKERKGEPWPLENSRGPNPRGVRFQGEEGWIRVSRETLEAEPESLLKERIRPWEVHLHRSRDHLDDFLDAVRTRRPTAAPVETAHRSISIAHLGNIAMLLGRPIRWDPVREVLVGDDRAARLLCRAQRAPYQIT